MKTIARTVQQSTASPEVIFSLWADVNNWAAFDGSIEWAKLSGPLAEGAHCIIKPKGGPKVKATFLSIQPDTRLVNESHLPGAKLRFDHAIERQKDGVAVSVTVTIHGPLSWLWQKVIGKGQQTDLEHSTAKLIEMAEARG